MAIQKAAVIVCFCAAILAQTGVTDAQRIAQRITQLDQHWAAQIRVPISNIQEMRKAAGLPEDGGTWIEDLDAMTLKHLGQVLLVERKGICLTAHVLQKSPHSF
jgi:hypothetical protein